jgi:hypothetical protein
MRMNILYVVTGSLLLTLLGQCKKKQAETKLPNETQSGLNTLGVYVNNEAYTSKGSFNCAAYTIAYLRNTQKLTIATYENCGRSFDITLNNINQAGIYNIDNTSNYITYLASNPAININNQNSVQSGQITITRFDTTAKIISGRFNASTNAAGTGVFNFTEGRFDFTLNIY